MKNGRPNKWTGRVEIYRLMLFVAAAASAALAAASALTVSARGFSAFLADAGHMLAVFADGFAAFAGCFASLFVAAAATAAASTLAALRAAATSLIISHDYIPP
jgi:hypothetical protein